MSEDWRDSSRGALEGLLSLEASILRTLCLTVNATGSELKYKIMDTLSEDDFYFPVNKAIFNALTDLHRRGDYVVYTNLEDELRNRSVAIPEDFFIDELFQGEIPDLSTLSNWLSRLKKRVTKGPSSGSKPPIDNKLERTAMSAGPPVSSSPAVKPGASAALEGARIKSSPGQTAGVQQVKKPSEARPPASASPLAAKVAAAAPKRQETQKPRPTPTGTSNLASEGEDWGNYLSELATKQGKSFETGFVGLDERAEGLTTGVLLLVDQDRGRSSDFLKQLTDQVAARSGVPCLFISYENPKALVRIRTLSRLSGVPAKDIEKGRLKRDSPEWESVEKNGRRAAEWLKRVFVVEVDAGLDTGRLKSMVRQVAGSGGESTALLVIDRLEGLSRQSDSSQSIVTELKGLSESLDLLVVAATGDQALLSASDLDFAAVLTEGQGGAVELELLRAEDSQSTLVRFDYESHIHKFTEKQNP